MRADYGLERLLLLPFSFSCFFQSRSSKKKMKNPVNFLSRITKPKISNEIRNFISSFKSLPRLFGHKKREKETEMEIGFPTDVKHITHIGADGTSSSAPTDLHTKAAHFISLRQFELAMAAQPDNATASS